MSVRYEKTKLVLIMLIIYGLAVFGIINYYPLYNTSEEVGALSGAASLAGLDWSGTIGNSGYYGIGWYSLFFWVFKLTDSPYLIYRIILYITAFLKPLVFLVVYYICKNFFEIKSEVYLFSLAFLASFIGAGTGIVNNEITLEVCIWLVMLLACKSIQYNLKGRGLFYLILMIVVCVYSLFLHTRALTLLIATALVFLLFAVFKRNLRALLPTLVLPFLYFLANILISGLQSQLWGLSSGDSLRNSTVTVSSNIDVFDPNTWNVWAHMLLGMISTESLITGGIFIIAIIGFIWFLVSFLKKKESCLNIYAYIILGISILCIGAVILAFLVSSWFNGIYSSWGQENAGALYDYKGLMYVRYWDIFAPPFIICILAFLPKVNYKRILNLSFIFIIVIYVLFTLFIVPLVMNNSSAAGFLYGIGHYSKDLSISTEYYLKCILISLLVILIALILVNFRNWEWILLPFICFTVYTGLVQRLEYGNDIRETMSSKILSSYEKIIELNNENIDIGAIYLYDESGTADSNWKIYSVAQFYLNDYYLLMDLPETLNETDIVISTGRSSFVEDKYEDILFYVLDDNEVWYSYMLLN